jgi:hypothetical protein
MFSSNSEQIKAEARQRLSGKDAQTLAQLWDEIYCAFQTWKQEHGDRKPKPARGLLSDLSGKPMPFKKAEPWECTDLPWPNPVGLALKLWREDYAPLKVITDREGFGRVLAVLIVKFADTTNPSDLLTAHDYFVRYESTVTGIITGRRAVLQSRDKNLDKGRPIAVKARKEKSAKKQADLIEAIKALFDKPDKPGWGWTNPLIVDFLKKGNYGYADSTLMVEVKREAAKYRKARKEEQANKYLNR